MKQIRLVSIIVMIVPVGIPNECSVILSGPKIICIPDACSSVRLAIVTSATVLILARASPRNPKCCGAAMSCSVAVLLVGVIAVVGSLWFVHLKV